VRAAVGLSVNCRLGKFACTAAPFMAPSLLPAPRYSTVRDGSFSPREIGSEFWALLQFPLPFEKGVSPMASKCACDVYRRILAMLELGHRTQAIAELVRRLKTHPIEGASWELLGILLFDQGKLNWAQSAIERASILIPLSPRGQLLLAKCYERSNYLESARTIYRHVASIAELETSLLEPLACGLGSCGELELALQVCRVAARRLPDNPDPLIGIVHYMRQLRRPVEHILPVMFRAHQLEPLRAEYRITLDWLLHESGKSNQAAGLLTAIPSEQFECVHCLIRMQHIFEITGNSGNADDCRRRLDFLASEKQLGGSST
jgi:hypothetical protein